LINDIKKINTQGFTLIEAIVAMVIFAIGFTGLYFLFSVALQSVSNTEKKMYLNLMSNRIIETIATQAQNNGSELFDPSLYQVNLTNCDLINPTTMMIAKTWCNDLNKQIGAYRGLTGEIRSITIQGPLGGTLLATDTSLIVNISFSVPGGQGANMVSTYATKKIRKYSN
jgi:prepilin-type N-terminal cleavage/methylation domain-containing protein